MTITAKVVAHSRAENAPDLITLQVKYPRMVHAEFMTHRVFSRNASSSRAIPIERMIRDVEEDPAMPVAWGSNKPGMQAGEEIDAPVVMACNFSVSAEEQVKLREQGFGPWEHTAQQAWLEAKERAVDVARAFAKAGYHKQIVNRLLEPFAHISVVVTATDWQNFFDLRCHPDADPTMRAVAEAMRDAIAGSFPDEVDGNWHLPYLKQSDWHWAWEQTRNGQRGDRTMFDPLAMISAARCARVSYLNHDGTSPDIEKDLALAQRLFESRHMSPFEHQAQAAELNGEGGWFYEHLQGNFTGWNQHRKFLELRI